MNTQSLRITTIAVAAIMAAAILSPSALAQNQIEVEWAQLASALEGRVVSTVLVDGPVLRGRVLDVSPTGLRFEVKKTSNRAEYPKGEGTVPREQLSAFSYTERRGYWRGAGAAIGVAGAAAAISPLVAISRNEGRDDEGLAFAVLGAIGGAIGYGIGHAADTHKTTVMVAKD